jgi:hypothetical protein
MRFAISPIALLRENVGNLRGNGRHRASAAQEEVILLGG